MVHPVNHASRQQSDLGFRLTGPLTIETAPQLIKRLQELHHSTLSSISLDLTEVDEVDSSALATLLWSLHYFADKEIQINITGVSPKLGALVELYKLDKMFLLSHS